MRLTRRTTLALAATAVAVLAVGTAQAQDRYPSRPVTLIVPQNPGGANDTIARIVAQKLAEQMGQPVVVENRAGAGGNIGTAAAAKAKNDGHTLLLTVNSAHVINPALYKNAGFDPVKDFEPVTPVANAGYVLVANNDFKPSNVAELVAAAKAQPGQIAYASAGNGTLNHLLGEMLQKATGTQLMHVPYRGAAASVADVVGGRVPVSIQSMPSAVSFIRNGQLKVLGVVNEKRINALPDVPTVGETVKGYGSTPWYGVFAPAGTPKPIVDRLHAEIVKALASAEVQEKLAAVGCETFHTTPDKFAAMIREELPAWARIVKESGATID